MTTNINDIRAALACIPANLPRDEWVRMGMALKSELSSEGYTLFVEWSATAESFKESDAKSAWRSFKASGGVSIASLFHLAKEHGYKPPTDRQNGTVRNEQPLADTRARDSRTNDAESAQRDATHHEAAKRAVAQWNAASEQGTSPYLERKRVKAVALRFETDSTILVPLRNAAGELWNVQRIAPDGQKRFLKGGRKSGLWAWLGDRAHAEVLLVAEGYATAASLYEATGYPVAVAFDCGNLRAVAKAIRAAHAKARIVVCGDDDAATADKTGRNPGRENAQAAALDVRGIAVLPQGLQAGESDFNDMAVRLGGEAVCDTINAALATEHQASAKSDAASFDMFTVNESGVWFVGIDTDGSRKPPRWMCSRLDVVARTRDFDGQSWGYLIEWRDPLAQLRTWAMPARMLAGDGNEYRAALLNGGLHIAPGTAVRSQLTQYIQTRTPEAFARCTDRIGWHGNAFVLPRETIGSHAADAERVVFQSDVTVENTFGTKGTLAQWRDAVAAPCVGNSRLAFAVSCAFASPLLRFVSMESGGFHLRGDSSSGKTTALRVAASVYGGKKYMQRWRTTDNALEAIAAQHCDALLILDELAQVDPKTAGECAYMLANGQSKARAARTGQPKPRLAWRLLFLSAGEIGLAAHMSEGGKRSRAGQELRMADVPADANAGMGIFEQLHEHEGGAAFATHMTRVSETHYGTAGLAFIGWLIAHHDGLAKRLRGELERITLSWIPKGASGQVDRVAGRFAIAALGGELATEAGLTGWATGEAEQAAKSCFDAWLASRGGAGNAEERQIIAQVRHFIEAHGAGRFTWWHRAADDHAPNTLHRAGFKRMLSAEGKPIRSDSDHGAAFGERMKGEVGEEVQTEYFILLEVFNREVCQGFDSATVKQLLRDRGFIACDADRLDHKTRLPGIGNARCIKLLPSIFDDDAE
jgi:putative DNA primase/helicase